MFDNVLKLDNYTYTLANKNYLLKYHYDFIFKMNHSTIS